MLKLKRLIFSNIGRFTKEQTINFDGLSSLIQIDAENRNTGGSSGSGKSTLFNALDWLLGLSSLTTGVLQSRLTKDHISVSGEFDWDGRQVLIHRAKKLSITIDGIETTGSSKLTEEKLDEILGLPRHLFGLLLHKRQGETGFFLEFTPSKMNEFLVDCLGLSSISSKIDLIDAKTKILILDKTRAQSELQSAQAALEATKSAILALGDEPKTDLTKEILDSYKTNLSGLSLNLDLIIENHQKERLDLDQKKPSLITIPYDKTKLSAIEKEISDLEDQINKVLDLERQRQATVNKEISDLKISIYNQTSSLKLANSKESSAIKTRIVELNQLIKSGGEARLNALKIAGQIKIIRNGVCHVCDQSWVTNKAKLEEEKLLQDLDKYKSIIELSVQASKEIEEKNFEYTLLTEKVSKEILFLETQLSKALAELNEKAKPYIPEELKNLNSKLRDVSGLKLVEIAAENAHNKEQNSLNQSLLQSFLEKQKNLNNKHQLELARITKEVSEAKAKYEQCGQAIKMHQEVVSRYGSTYEALKTKESDVTSKIAHIDQKLVQLTEDLEIAEEAKKCLKSYLSCSFDDALISISETATRILRAVPTMTNATIRLEGTKETAKGAVKEEVTACLDNDGELDIPIKSLSGGERSAVDLAVDLAVIELIEDRTNTGIDFLCLDEIFNGFDSLGIEHALEMLKTFGINKKLLLVEHDGIAKEYIQNRITIVRNGETSFIK